jgi:antagonist of KipI
MFPWSANFYSWYFDEGTFNVIPGPEWAWLDAASQKLFARTTFTTTKNSDKMGISLDGPKLIQANTEQLVSTGVVYGTIQLLPNGNLVILAADHPTTGGYPRIANIISVHLPKLAQVSPGVKLRFLTTTEPNATDLFLLQQKEIKQMQTAVKLQLPPF